jgi:hypothetical protein
MPGSAPWTRLNLPAPVHAFAADGARVVAALADGRLLRSPDAGVAWHPISGGSGESATVMLLASDLLLVGTAAGVLRADAGAWRPGGGFPEGAEATGFAAQETALIAGTTSAGVHRSDDGGTAWEPAGRGLPFGGERLRIHAVAGGAHGLLVAHALGVSRSGDGGRTWAPAALGLPLQIPQATLAADGKALYAGVGGRLYRALATSEDSMLAWEEVYDGPGAGRPLNLLASASGVLYAALATPPHLVRSMDGGVGWEGVPGELPAPPLGLAVAASWLLARLPDGTLWRGPRAAAPVREPPALTLDVEGGRAAEPVLVTFGLPAPAFVALTVHDMAEREVALLAQGPFAAGRHGARLPPEALAPGFYRCRLRAGAQSRVVPLVLLG